MRFGTFALFGSLAGLIISACLAPVSEGDAGTDGGSGGGGGDAGVRCLVPLGYDKTVCAPTAPGRCGGASCGDGQVCCVGTATCVNEASRATDCPAGTTSQPGATPCSSNADCTDDEFCMADRQQFCTGAGHCQPRANCGYCEGPAGVCAVCGCNGVTYDSPQAACVAGVRVATHGACGQPATTGFGPPHSTCGADDQCPSGSQCCALTGLCFESNQPWRCQFQPDGAVYDCEADSECTGASGAGGGPGPNTWCAGGEGCASPGTCRLHESSSNCGGEVLQVCGCNGTTYVNACWAAIDGVRVADVGACP